MKHFYLSYIRYSEPKDYVRYGIKCANADRNINMQKINLKVAYCTQCDGYRTSTLTSKINNNHDDVIDHYMYHGSPWFTFDYQVFSEISSKKDVKIREVELSQHRKNDRKYCTCSQVATHEIITAITPKVEANKHKVFTDFSDNEYYFRDVYHLVSMFH